MPSTTTTTTTTTLVDLKNKQIDSSSSSLKSTMSNPLEKQESNGYLPSPTTSITSPIIPNDGDINPLLLNGSDVNQLPNNLDYNDLDILIKMERANKLVKNDLFFFIS
jgi:hypothetical protein